MHISAPSLTTVCTDHPCPQHVGVLELTVEAMDDDGKVIDRFGVGWGTLPLFRAAAGDGAAATGQQSLRLWNGTPRQMMTIDGIAAVDLLHPMGFKAPTSSTVVSYSVEPCDALGQFSGLMAVDTLVGRPDRIPGVWNINEASNRCPLELEDAVLAPAVAFTIDYTHIKITPSVAILDREIADSAAVGWSGCSAPAPGVGCVGKVTERRLRYGNVDVISNPFAPTHAL